MKIEAVDFFYVSMPEVTTDADGSQDALVVRVAGGGLVGWGECEASPLVSIAAFICPMSHGACRPVAASVLGQTVDSPADIARIAATIAYNSMDLLQAPHTWSGIEMALWDLLGKARGEPVWRLLGYPRAFNKTPYASQLFGNSPAETLAGGRSARAAGFRAVKFGWGPMGQNLRPGPDLPSSYFISCQTVLWAPIFRLCSCWPSPTHIHSTMDVFGCLAQLKFLAEASQI